MKKVYTIIALAMFMQGSLLTVSAQDSTDANLELTNDYVKNHSFEDGTSSWTSTNLSTQKNSSFKLKDGATYLEKWTGAGGAVGSASVLQTLTGLPVGHYLLTAVAQNIQQNSDAVQTGAVIFAGSVTTTVTAAAEYAVEFDANGGNVAIGFRATNASGNWISVDNFRLYYIHADLTLLQQAATNAETTLTSTMQPKFATALETAIAIVKALTENDDEATIRSASFTLAEALAAAKENVTAITTLKKLLTNAKTCLSRKMAASYKEALQKAYDAAYPIVYESSDEDIDLATSNLQKAYDDASLSYTAYTALNKAINTANRLTTEGKEGAEAMLAALEAAQSVLDNDNATPEEMNAATAALENATLLFHVQNPTGKELTVKTLGVVQGATEIFARLSVSGGTAREKGFCYSTEETEPTIFGTRTTFCYSNNGDIYAIQDLKPATVYYVRAYAISSGYQLSYGDVVKVPTRPLGNVTFDYDNAGDEATNKRIYAACEEGVWMWNHITGIQNFHLSAHYVPGVGAGGGTADCSYGGYMRVSQNTAYQRTGTILHEGSHGQGVISYTDWVNSMYRTDGDRGDWLGPRVDRVMQFLENSKSAKLHGDNIHMWPYGINGANEDTGAPMLYRANALIVGALAEDAIKTPNMDFMKPAYSFTQDDETKYYIKSEAPARGLSTSYLRQKTASGVRIEEMTAEEAFANDSCAWYITFDPATCYYTLQNAATGRYLNLASGAASLATNTNNAKFHLLASRKQTKVDDFTFAGTSYWLVTSSTHNALGATTTGASSTSFNHADGAAAQRWLLLTADEVTRFAEARGEELGISVPRSAHVMGSLDIAGTQGGVIITAHGQGQEIAIFTMDGRRVERVYVQRDGTARVRLPRGIYLVGSQKVIVR